LGSHDWQSKHPRLGRCNNPWDLSRTVGGSSGGSAASLAAGFADLEVGSDVAGSIRVPAHYCGVVGLRPTEGVLSDEGHGDLPMARAPLPNLAVVGPMARCVDDVQAAFDVMRGEGAAASTRDAPAPSALRLAWSGQQGEFGLSSQTERILAKTRDALESSGADVHDASPGVDTDYAMRIWGRIHGYEMRQSMPAATGLPLVRHLTSWAWFRMRLGAGRIVDYMRDGFTGGEQQYARDLEARAELQDDLAAFFDEYDAWLLPSAPFPAFRHQRTGAPIEYDGRTVNYADSHAAYQCPVVVMENPVVSLPVGVTDGGLPVGIQIAGTRFEESALLEVAAAIESVRSAPFPEPGLD
jgi:amidase